MSSRHIAPLPFSNQISIKFIIIFVVVVIVVISMASIVKDSIERGRNGSLISRENLIQFRHVPARHLPSIVSGTRFLVKTLILCVF